MTVSSIFNKTIGNKPILPGVEEYLKKSFLLKGSSPIAGLAALTSLAATPVLTQVLGPVVEAIVRNPKQAAEVARQASEIVAPLIRYSAEQQEKIGDSATETTTTTRKEKNGSSVTETTTTTTKTTKTRNLADEARNLADQIEELGAGLPEGQIRLGDNETITFEQLQTLGKSIAGLLRKLDEKGEEKTSIDIGEETTPNKSEELQTERFDTLKAIAGVAKDYIDPVALKNLKAFAGHLSTDELGVVVKEILQ